MHSLRFAPTSRILEGFETIAHQSLRPNERPKIPIVAGNKYLEIRPKQGSR
jgi:hypothetical protein